MIRCDALIVGGGPAGSTCARVLRQAGWNVLVIDRARFPRDKVCAGWLTPEVFPLLDLDPADYRAAGLTLQEISAFRTGLLPGRLLETRYPRVVSYAIRRCEFDTFLLARAGAQVLEHTPATSFRRTAARSWVVNESIETPVVVGAGGHFCPVARHLRGRADIVQPVIAKEAEFRLDAEAADAVPDVPQLFFCRDFEGYGWCVRKGRYLNIGIGRRGNANFAEHLRRFTAFLEREHGIREASRLRWRGHAYLASGTGARPLTGPGMLLAGDAAGLAYAESGEGIKPAIESGRLAAETLIAANGPFEGDSLQRYAAILQRKHPPLAAASAPVRALSSAAGRLLMGSRAFTRHVLLDRWFLRVHAGSADGRPAGSDKLGPEAASASR